MEAQPTLAPTEAEAEYVPVVIVVKDGPWTYELQYNRPPAVCASVVLGNAMALRRKKVPPGER